MEFIDTIAAGLLQVAHCRVAALLYIQCGIVCQKTSVAKRSINTSLMHCCQMKSSDSKFLIYCNGWVTYVGEAILDGDSSDPGSFVRSLDSCSLGGSVMQPGSTSICQFSTIFITIVNMKNHSKSATFHNNDIWNSKRFSTLQENQLSLKTRISGRKLDLFQSVQTMLSWVNANP